MASLVLGSFSLIDNATNTARVMADGTSWGAPVPIEVKIDSFLQDGAVVVTQGHDNREVTVRVRFYGTDLTALNTKEAALIAELEKPNTLTWTPDNGPASVFVVVTSSLAQEDERLVGDVSDDPWRTYNVRLVCEAFPQSVAEITVPALPASGSTTTLVDAGSATTGWTGTHNGVSATVAVVSGAVGVTTSSMTGESTIALTRTGSITTSSTKYLVIDWRPTTGSYVLQTHAINVYGDGVQLAQLSNVSVPGIGYRTTVYVPASSIAVLRLDYFTRSLTGGGTNSNQPQARTFHVDNINRTDVRPSLGTTRQQARAFSVSGSAPAPGSLTISHASASLGDVLAYIWSDPDGVADAYSPALSQYTNPAGRTADAATVFGSRVSVGASSYYTLDVPAATIPPGPYVMLARVAAAAGSFSGTLQGSTKTIVNSTDLDAEYSFPATAASFTTAYAVYAVCKMNLPSVNVRDASTSTLRIAVRNNSASTVYFDEVWLFSTTLGQLIWVQAGTGAAASGGPSRRVVIDPATIDRPYPVVLRGHAADGSDAFSVGIKSWQQPRFTPPQVNLFSVTTNTPDADASFTYRPRWHTNAAS